MPKTIVAIGGGDIRRGRMLPIAREIIRRTGKRRPRFLFVPTASSDSLTYADAMEKYFGKKLHCQVEILSLIREKHTAADIRQKILRADIVYVGGGNTLMMMKVWRRLGVDRMLREAYRKGIVLAGVSAGSLCWFRSGHSDSKSFYGKKKWTYIDVRGLGLIDARHCPHYDSETRGRKRRLDFQRMMRRKGGIGIALDDLCALVFVDHGYRVLSVAKRAHAYKVFRKKNGVLVKRLEPEMFFRPVSMLLQRR